MLHLFSSSLPSTRRRSDYGGDASSADSVIPRHPTQNPHVPEGRYEAVVHDVRVWAYGNRDNHDEDLLVRIVLYIPDGNRYIVSDIDLPKLDRKVPFERLQQFADVLGLDPPLDKVPLATACVNRNLVARLVSKSCNQMNGDNYNESSRVS